MNKFDLIQLRKRLSDKNEIVFISLPASERIDRFNVPCEMLILESDLVDIDESGIVAKKIMEALEKVIALEHVSERHYDKLNVEIKPLLFYDVTSLPDNSETIIADGNHLSYSYDTIGVIINISSIEFEEKNVLLEIPITGTVKFQNFLKIMNRLGFSFNYDSVEALAQDIFKYAKTDELYPDFNIEVFNDEQKKYTK